MGIAPTAAPKCDLSTTITPPVGTHVYESGHYDVKVSNLGAATATGNVVTITLPATNTSPTVYLMGHLGAMSAGCTASGLTVTCTLASIKKGKSITVGFDLELAAASVPLSIVANATSAVADANALNNKATHVANLLDYVVIDFTGAGLVSNDHCTGTDLTSFYECELFPSSITTHDVTLNADHTITFGVGVGPEYTGTWWSDGSTHLGFSYLEYGIQTASFSGYGVNGSCWEGETIFDGSEYNSQYQVCVL